MYVTREEKMLLHVATLLLAIHHASALRSPPRSADKAVMSQTRRTTAAGLVSSASLFIAGPAYAEKSRTDGYAVQRSDREWAYVLGAQQYYIRALPL